LNNLLGFEGTPKIFVGLAFLSAFPLILKRLLEQKNAPALVAFFIIIIICIHVHYSLYVANNPLGTLRFFLILVLIVLSYYLELPRYVLTWFMFFILLQSLFLLAFEIYLIFLASKEQALYIRQFFLKYNIGDVYTYTGFFYRIQILGNPLVPFGFFLSIILRKNNIMKIILCLGVMISANLAFYIATITFLALYFLFIKPKNNFQLINNAIKIFLIFLLCSFPIYIYAQYILEKKTYSLSVRADQFDVLINDMSNSIITVLLGKGLGNIINVQTPLRDYSLHSHYIYRL